MPRARPQSANQTAYFPDPTIPIRIDNLPLFPLQLTASAALLIL